MGSGATSSAREQSAVPKESIVCERHGGLAGINDLQRYLQESAGCGKSIPRLLGGSPSEVPERYRDASPAEMLPLGIKQVLIIGAQDTIVRPQHNRTYAETAQKSGDDVQLIVLDDAASLRRHCAEFGGLADHRGRSAFDGGYVKK